MRNKSVWKLVMTVVAANVMACAVAQNNALYFMKTSTQQHWVNPAFQPKSKLYVGMPLLSNLSLEGGNSNLVFTDVFKNITINGEKRTVLFLDKNAPKGSTDDFLDKLSDGNRFFYEQRLNILDFGYRINEGQYVTLGVANRASVGTVIPKSIFELALKGVDEGETFRMNGDHLAVDALLYTELALGYSHALNEKLTVGAKLKYLYGHANLHTDMKDITITGNEDKWAIEGDGYVDAAIPGLKLYQTDEGMIDDLDFDLDGSSVGKAQGGGFAADLGASYKINDRITVSASVLDLGFINWKKNINSVRKVGDFVWDGIEYDINDDTTDYGQKYEDMLDNMFRIDSTRGSYRTALYTKVNVGGEYSLLEDKLGVGLLYRGQFYRSHLYGNAVMSANFRPIRHLSATVTYDMFDGEWNNVGLGLDLNAGPVNWFCMVDNIPVRFAKSDGALIPRNLRDFRFSTGLNFVFGRTNKKKDAGKSALASADALPEKKVGKKTIKSQEQPEELTAQQQVAERPMRPAENAVEQQPVVNEPVKPTETVSQQPVAEMPVAEQKPEAEVKEKTDTVATISDALKQLSNEAFYGIKFVRKNGMKEIDPASCGILDKIADAMLADPEVRVVVLNHSSLVKNKNYSYDFTEEQANLVRSYLVEKEVEYRRITTVAMGNDRPLVPGNTPDAVKANNRTELIFLK